MKANQITLLKCGRICFPPQFHTLAKTPTTKFRQAHACICVVETIELLDIAFDTDHLASTCITSHQLLTFPAQPIAHRMWVSPSVTFTCFILPTSNNIQRELYTKIPILLKKWICWYLLTRRFLTSIIPVVKKCLSFTSLK